jgi:hypothetical protein
MAATGAGKVSLLRVAELGCRQNGRRLYIGLFVVDLALISGI